MKAITLHPEWIVPILSDHPAAKRTENRSWRLPEAQIGQWLALHSGAAIGGRWRLGAYPGRDVNRALHAVLEMATAAGWPLARRLQTLARVDGLAHREPTDLGGWDHPARVRVIDALWHAASPGHIVALIRVDSQDTEQRTGWDFGGYWHWRIGAVVPLVAPILQRGAQGLWSVPDAARVEIRRQIGGAP